MVASTDITIRKFNTNDSTSVYDIVIQAFQGKFRTLSTLSNEKLIELFKDLNLVAYMETEGILVAEKKSKVLGVIKLNWVHKNPKPKKIKFDIKRLCKKYGFCNIFKLFIGLLILQKKLAHNECYVDFLAVHPEAHGLGIGTQLITYCKDMCKNKLKLSKYTLCVAKSNKGAFRLYKKLGFKVIRPRKVLFSKYLLGQKDILFMCNDLES